MTEVIQNRRSIRKYKDWEVSREDIEKVLQAGILAPSSKNRQPWKFIVVSGPAKNGMLAAMRQGLEREKADPVLPESRRHIGGAEYTLSIMEQAPVTIFVVNPLGIDLFRPLSTEERVYETCNAQSVGAAIENMTLTATGLGFGSLWICDTYFAYRELMAWLNTDGELLAALTLGHPAESPDPRPRKGVEDVTEWRGI